MAAVVKSDQFEEAIDGDQNALQKHVKFFDRNNDGVVYPWETFQGFRAIGSGILLSSVAALFINMGLSGKTRPGCDASEMQKTCIRNVKEGLMFVKEQFTYKDVVRELKGKKFPNLLFPINIQNINMAKHGSDSGVYDTHGRFVASRFEEIFHKYARTNSDSLTSEEVDELIKGNREPKDYGGWIGGLAEWKVLYYLAKDENGLLSKDKIRAVYDGSLFEKMAQEKLAKSSKKKPKSEK